MTGICKALSFSGHAAQLAVGDGEGDEEEGGGDEDDGGPGRLS